MTTISPQGKNNAPEEPSVSPEILQVTPKKSNWGGYRQKGKRRKGTAPGTPLQKTVMLKLMRGVPFKQALIESGASVSLTPSSFRHTKEWGELLDKYLPEEKLMKVHDSGLDAVKHLVVNSELQEVPDHHTRKGYLELAYKLRGKMNSDAQGRNTFNFNIYNEAQLKRVASRIVRNDGPKGEEQPRRLHDSDEPPVHPELAS